MCDLYGFIYRFIKRYAMRYGGRSVKLLFVLSEEEGSQGLPLSDAASKFGLCLQDTLRRSDMILQSKPNQFFLFLPQLSEEDFPKVLQRILTAWEARAPHSGIRIEHAAEFTVHEVKIYDPAERRKP